MVELKLKVVNAIAGTACDFAPAPADFPQGVTGAVEQSEGRDFIRVEGGLTLLLTGDAEQALAQARRGGKDLRVVFVGDPARVAADAEALEDVWSPADGEALLRLRFRRLVKDLKTRFDAEFYVHALETTIDTVPDMLWYKRLDGIHMRVNDAFTEIVHKPKSDVVGKDHFYIWDAPRPAEGNDFACAESEEIAISTGKTYICDEPVKTREGMKQFTTYKTPVYDPFGNVFGTVGVGHDVTNFSNLGIELSILIENMPFPMTIFTPDWKVVRMNRHFMQIVGAKDAESFDYRRWKGTVPVPTGERAENAERHVASREYEIEVDGEPRSFVLSELEIRDYFDNVSGYFCTMQDITYERAYEKFLIKAANTDALTGMHNRRYIYKHLSDNLAERFHLLYMDMDRFKAVNDRHGHSAGDAVLVETARLIDRHFPDAVTARLGGDEFAVVDALHTREEIEARCLALEDAVRAAFAKYDCGTSISIGVIYSDGTASDIDRLINAGDAGMYAVKDRHHANE